MIFHLYAIDKGVAAERAEVILWHINKFCKNTSSIRLHKTSFDQRGPNQYALARPTSSTARPVLSIWPIIMKGARGNQRGHHRFLSFSAAGF